ncbi:MAG: tRNA (adenosine(37)-N6)-threonylcarbamoyltransferase complex dimerization subunit type 1 TsaB [Pseudomonadota bacterium]
MRILALDTCLGACSAAVWQDGVIRAHEWRPMRAGHAEALVPMLEQVRTACGLDYADFDRLAVSIGPGSFAGVRIGLAAARGICVARNLPLVGVNTLELLAASLWDEDGLAIAIDARNDQVYFQAFAGRAACDPPALLTCAEAAAYLRHAASPWRLAGSGAGLIGALCDGAVQISHPDLLPDAAYLAGLAASRQALPGDQIVPLYLRAPDAKLPGLPA